MKLFQANIKKYITGFLIWRLRHLSHRNFLLLLSFAVGLASGLAAVILKNLTHFIGHLVTTNSNLNETNWWLLVLPAIGIVLTVIYVKIFLKDDISHGVSKVLYSISRGKGILSKSKMYSSMISSALTVSFGGSVGLEAPVVLTGSAIGSNIGQIMRLDYRSLILLIACGATGAVAAIFKAPLAGVVFALEVLLLDLTMSSIIPLLISACTAAVLSSFLLGRAVIFSFDINAVFHIANSAYYIILGLFVGLISVYFIRLSRSIENFFGRLNTTWRKAVFGGLALSALIYFFPPLFGEGFTYLTEIIQGNGESLLNNTFFYSFRDNIWMFFGFILLILVFKVIAMAITNGSGGVGGVFAPSLFMGGVAGFFLARLLNHFFHLGLPENNFALAGMAGMMAGVMHAPLTAIFLIAEITGGYQLFIPLIIASIISFLTNSYFEPHSIYTKKLAETGQLITHHKDRAALLMMNLEPLIDKGFEILKENDTLRNVVTAISTSNRNFFPVLDDNDKFIGIVFIDDVRKIMFKPELYDTTLVKDFKFMPSVTVQINEKMHSIAKKFGNSDQFNFVVLDGDKYVGFVSRAKFFSEYQKILHEFSQE